MKIGKLIIGNGILLEQVNVGIQNGIITEVSTEQLKKTYEKKIDASDKIVMPGLIDAHVHLVYTGEPGEPATKDLSDEYLALRAAESAKKALKSGVTTLADAGGIRNTIFALRNVINDGVVTGPRIKVSGSMITMTGGRATRGHRVIGGGYEVDGADDARKKTRELLMYYGADWIKLGATGALSSPHTGARDPQLTVDEMRACVEEAHKCGRKVHAHCYGEQGISNALEAGVDVIVHGQTLNEEHLRIMKERETILMPTLSTFQPKDDTESAMKAARPISSGGVREETDSNFRNALKHGIIISMGTDSGMTSTLFGNNPRDLVYLVEKGMAPNQAIVAATLNAAKSIGVEDKLGTIEVGKYADMLILNKDPLENIKILGDPKNIEHIMLNGEFVEHLL